MMAFITADSIQVFFGYLDHAFPSMKRTVKMHLLEHHVTDVSELMGEQGTEAVHNQFSQLYRTYGCMAKKVQRLKCIMQEHAECVLQEKQNRSRKSKSAIHGD